MARTLHRDITVIGGSAGGISVLREMLAGLPADYPAAVFIVVHVSPEAPSVLHQILDRVCKLPVAVARSGARVRPGTVTLASPDLHLVLGRSSTVRPWSARESTSSLDRRAVPLRRADLRAAGHGCVIVSGMLDDGAAGLWAIKNRGGIAVVQDPADAEFPDMPRNALQVTAVDYRLPLREIASMLARIAHQKVEDVEEGAPQNMATEVRVIARNDTNMEDLDAIAERVPFTCPECGGALWEITNGGPRYRCHNGHAYSLNTLASEQAVQVEAALWAGSRRLEESERLSRRMESFARARGNEQSATYH
ncbi:MAG TPA: chemotaxis protein CheB, partial [Casimicrobiaceae bacterium]|nr:chemotaxis protein CheB [Casimicrobiaceae bacterium]